MGFDLARTETVFANNDNQEWLGSAHGTTEADSCTLDPTPTLVAFPDGQVPSGVEISERADGRFGPFAAADATAGRRAGFLLHAVQVRAGVNAVGALLWHGQVIAAKVPLGVGAVAPAAASHPLISLV